MSGKMQEFCMCVAVGLVFLIAVAVFGQGSSDPNTAAVVDAEDTVGELETTAPRTFGARAAEMWEGLKIKWALGGNTMWALGFLAVIALVYAVDRMLCLRRGRVVPARLADKANGLWQKGRYAEVKTLAERSNSSLGRVILFIVEHRNNSFETINAGAEDIVARDFSVHTRRNYPLSAVGTISPLLGLMGTVFGLMGAFATIGVVGSMDDPAALADDIGKALITTAAGLILAVPSLGLYHYFKNRTSQYAAILGEEVSNLMNAWFLKKEADDES